MTRTFTTSLLLNRRSCFPTIEGNKEELDLSDPVALGVEITEDHTTSNALILLHRHLVYVLLEVSEVTHTLIQVLCSFNFPCPLKFTETPIGSTFFLALHQLYISCCLLPFLTPLFTQYRWNHLSLFLRVLNPAR